MELSTTYETPKIEQYAQKFAKDLIKLQGAESAEAGIHRVQWTKLSGEKDYRVPYDVDQQKFYGLPAGWEQMTDDEIAIASKEGAANQPWEARDRWPYELIEPTVC